MHTYATTKELKEREFKAKRENIKLTTGIQLTFISKKKLRKQHFLAKYDHFLSADVSFFEALLGWEFAHVCHNLQNEKERIWGK